MTTTQQLELGFNATQSRIYGRKREARVARGQWWFAKMRAVVANAAGWPEQNGAPAEQIFFSGANRQMEV